MLPHTKTTTQQIQRGPASGTALQTPPIHPRYAEARERAYQLETEIESAQKQYAAQLRSIIQKLQLQFYQKYGDKLYELEDLEHAIQNIQYQGQRALQRQLTALYLKGACEDHSEHGGALVDPALTKQRFQAEAKQLCEQFRQQYCPEDNYQAKRDAEAAKLQMAILGGGRGGMMLGGGSGGGGVRVLQAREGMENEDG